MAINTAVNLAFRNYANGFSIQSISGQRFQISDHNVRLIAQADTDLTLPNAAATELLAASHFGAAGDLMYGTGANAFAVLPRGAVGQVLMATADGIAWSNAAEPPLTLVAADRALAANASYVVDAGAEVVLTLPADADFGETVKLINYAGGFRINQAAGESIRVGLQTTTVGTAGFMRMPDNGSNVELLSMGDGRWVASAAIQGAAYIDE